MKSLKELFRIGAGPSSSHSMGPEAAAIKLRQLHPNAQFKITLCGSLALTGKGHGTDEVLRRVLGNGAEIAFDCKRENLPHPNTMLVNVFEDGKEVARHTVLSVGGGRIVFEGEKLAETPEVYPHDSFEEIKKYLNDNEMRLPDYVFEAEPDAQDYLTEVWAQMRLTIKEGLNAEGELPGGLGVLRKADRKSVV